MKSEDGLTLVNFSKARRNNNPTDPFILAAHASQVFYSLESSKDPWRVVMRAPPRVTSFDDDVIDDSNSQLDVSLLEL